MSERKLTVRKPGGAAAQVATSSGSAQIILFEHDNFNIGHDDAWKFEVFASVNLTDDLNDNVSSIVVISGMWKLWRNHDFKPDGDEGCIQLSPGNYPSIEALAKGWNDQLSSIELVRYT